jgi:hypothetical protein
MVSGPIALSAPSTSTSWTYLRPTNWSAVAIDGVTRVGSARVVMRKILNVERRGHDDVLRKMAERQLPVGPIGANWSVGGFIPNEP